LQSRTALFDACSRKMRKKRLADALAAKRRAHVQILEIEARAATEGREVEEPEREAGRLGVPLRDLAEQTRMLSEDRRRDVGLGRFDFMGELLVLRELAEQREDQSGLAGTRTVNRKRHPALTPRLRP